MKKKQPREKIKDRRIVVRYVCRDHTALCMRAEKQYIDFLFHNMMQELRNSNKETGEHKHD